MFPHFWLVMAIVALSVTVRSATGFGNVLIAVPLLTLFLPLKTAVPLAVLTTVFVAVWIVIQDWKRIHWRSAGWLLMWSLPGIPVGLYVLRYVPEHTVQAVLGLLIIAFAIFSLWRPSGVVLVNDKLAWLFGFTGGVLGGAYGINGPPLVVYGAMRGWTPEYFRATLQAYFLPASVAGLTGYWLTGLLTAEVSWMFLWTIPVVLLATLVGRWVNRRLHPERFVRYIYLLLIFFGTLMLWQAFRA